VVHAVAPVQLIPPHWPYKDCTEPPAAAALALLGAAVMMLVGAVASTGVELVDSCWTGVAVSDSDTSALVLEETVVGTAMDVLVLVEVDALVAAAAAAELVV